MITDKIRKINHDWKAGLDRRRVLVMKDVTAGYIPIPKAASSSLRRLVCGQQAHLVNPQLLEQDTRTMQKAVEKYIGRSMNSGQLFQLARSHFLFAYVRNPLTRVYSCYLDKVVKAQRQGRRNPLRPWGIAFDMDFEAFARRVISFPDNQSEQHFRCILSGTWKPLRKTGKR